MKNNSWDQVALVSRLLLGFLFIYHGLVPKILWLSPDEVRLVSASSLGISAEMISPIAGGLEILLGLMIIFFRKSMLPVYVAAFSLVFLLIYTAVVSPDYLLAAFNPVTTNIMGLGFCYLIHLSNTQKSL